MLNVFDYFLMSLTSRSFGASSFKNYVEQFEEFQTVHKFSNEIFNFSQKIKEIVEILFKKSRLILKLILYKNSIRTTYLILTGRLNTQVILLAATEDCIAGFNRFLVGTCLITPELLSFILPKCYPKVFK